MLALNLGYYRIDDISMEVYVTFIDVIVIMHKTFAQNKSYNNGSLL